MSRFNKELISGSVALLIAFNLFSFLNFVYQFLMARFLTAAEYGSLAALLSLIYALAVFSDSLQTIIAKHSSEENNNGKIKNLFKRTFRKALGVSALLFLIFLGIAVILSRVWEMPYYLIACTGLVIFGSLLSPVSRGIMQGKKRFKSLGYNLVIESSLKIIIAIGLIWLGFRVGGAIAGIVIATLISCAIAVFQIREFLRVKEENIKLPLIYRQSLLVFIFTLAVTLFYSMDIMIAKAIFTPEVAGYYAIASILGKIVFWGTQPISRAMLPIASQDSKDRTKKVGGILKNSLLILTGGIVLALLIFYEFPNFIVTLFSGREIAEASKVLFKVGLAMALLSYSNLLLLHKIAITREEDLQGKRGLKRILARGILFIILLEIEIIVLYSMGAGLDSFTDGLVVSAIIFLIGSLVVDKT